MKHTLNHNNTVFMILSHVSLVPPGPRLNEGGERTNTTPYTQVNVLQVCPGV